MIKDLKKANKIPSNIIYNVLGDNKLTSKKSKQQINHENYQKNQKQRKAQQRERYQQKRKQIQLTNQKLYQATSIQVLLSLKDYTELNPTKKKLWADFCWTFQDCQAAGFDDIVPIQKLEQVADKLIRDYYQTAREKSKVKGGWNSLSEEQQAKLIKYWGQEKARKEQELSQQLEQQAATGKEYEKELELAKFHEERGKIKCACYDCEAKKELRQKIQSELFKEENKVECPECGRMVKKLDEENGICKSCVKKYE